MVNHGFRRSLHLHPSPVLLRLSVHPAGPAAAPGALDRGAARPSLLAGSRAEIDRVTLPFPLPVWRREGVVGVGPPGTCHARCRLHGLALPRTTTPALPPASEGSLSPWGGPLWKVSLTPVTDLLCFAVALGIYNHGDHAKTGGICWTLGAPVWCIAVSWLQRGCVGLQLGDPALVLHLSQCDF